MAKPNSVVHFEMPAKDKKRVSDFYSKVFGWNMMQMGPDMGDDILAQTTETDENSMPKNPGAINGGFFDYKDDDLNRAPHLVISVDDLDESIKAVKEAGGKVEGEKMDIPGVGMYVSFRDSEDNVVGMLQPSR
jgi:predicted enzyme related to lactoylglutathione lyase